jgi:hypothetical protein
MFTEQSPFEREIDGEKCNGIVRKTGKRVWTANGDCQGKPITGKGSSAHAAVDHWEKRAKMKEWD